VEPANPALTSLDGVVFDKTKGTVKLCPEGKTGKVIIPDGVRFIAEQAFFNCAKLTEVTIPDSVTQVGYYGFAGCTGLTSLSLTDGVLNVGLEAFSVCSGLINCTLGHSVTNIDNQAFADCTGAVLVPGSVTGVGEVSFGSAMSGVYFEDTERPTIIASGALTGNPSIPPFYHLPGAAGWNDYYPAFLWSPIIQASEASFGIGTGRFWFAVTWARKKVVVIEAADSLLGSTWSPVSTNTLTSGTCSFTDPEWASHLNRFYRVRAQ
jgi:hypothetical protein